MRITQSSCFECTSQEAWKTLLEEKFPNQMGNCLDLSDCELVDVQAVSLLDYLYTKPIKFRFIDLSDNALTDVTAKKIAEVMIKMPSLCQAGWLGNMIKIPGNPISIEGLRACFAAMKKTERQPDFIVFSYHKSISEKDWKDLNTEYFEMRKKQDPIVRLATWLSSFFNWTW